jgi:hypothetical protein
MKIECPICNNPIKYKSIITNNRIITITNNRISEIASSSNNTITVYCSSNQSHTVSSDIQTAAIKLINTKF